MNKSRTKSARGEGSSNETLPRKFLFDHIPKTAGTTLFAAFQEILGKQKVAQLQNGTGAVEAETLLRTTSLRLAGGHLRFNPGHVLPPGIAYITFLRDPVDRALSLYYHARHMSGPAPRSYVEHAQRLEFDEFIACDEPAVREAISNHYVRHFSIRHAGTNLSLDQAKAEIDRYFLVGTVESLDESLLILCARAGWKPFGSLPNLNVSRHLRTEISARARRILEDQNQEDLALCEHVTDRLSKCRREALREALEARTLSRPSRSTEATADPDAQQPPAAGSAHFGSREVFIHEVALLQGQDRADRFASGEVMRVRVIVYSRIVQPSVTVGISIRDQFGRTFFGTNTALCDVPLSVSPNCSYECLFRVGLRLGAGDYRVGVTVHTGATHTERCFEWRDDAAFFSVAGFAARVFDGCVDLPCIVRTSAGIEHHVLTAFRGEIAATQLALAREFEVLVRNLGEHPWHHDGPVPVRVACRWIDKDGNPLPIEGPRCDLPKVISPGEQTKVTIFLGNRPSEAASTRITLVQEGVAWFDERGGPKVDLDARTGRCLGAPNGA